MKRSTLLPYLCLTSLLFFWGSTKTALGLSSTEVGTIAEDITVRIDGQNPGSGVLIEQKGNTYTVLTAAHVVATEDEYDIITSDNHRHTLSYDRVTKLPNVDLALVQFESQGSYKVAKLGKSQDVQRGAAVYVSGFPMPSQAITEPILNFSPGSITAHAKQRPLADGYAFVYTNKTLPGMSGGAVLDEKGKLVGIHGRADTEQNVQETEFIYLKTGFNLGIPLYTFLSLASNLELPPPPATLPNAEDWYLSGGNKSQQQNYQGAIADINQAIAQKPDFGEAYYRRYYAREKLGDPNAIDDLKQAIQLLNADVDQAETKLDRIDSLLEGFTILE